MKHWLVIGAIAGLVGATTAFGQQCPETTQCASWFFSESKGGCTPIPRNSGEPCGDQSVTDCSDPDVCAGVTCGPNNKPNGTACGDPSDSVCDNRDVCTAGSCVANHEPSTTECRAIDPATCNPAEFCTAGECPTDIPTGCPISVCRGAGFWSTHAGTEKGAFDIALETLELGGGSIEVCGEILDDTALNSNASALEAMCDSRPGRFQLARQLTAMALNCISTVNTPGLGSDCALVAPEHAVAFAECNAQCGSGTNAEIDSCVRRIECLNSGGIPAQANGQFFCSSGTCSDNGQACTSSRKANCADPRTAACIENPENCSTELLPLSYTSAGSAKACGNARKTACDIFDASCL
jgi:hypothetical protein